MSLKLGKAFITALRSNDNLQRLLGAKGTPLKGARIFAVARTEEDDKQDKIPYIVIQPNGINTDGSKDACEGTDTCNIDILCVAVSYPALIDLCEEVRATIADELTGDEDFRIDDYTFAASPVMMDELKPCYYQTLNYQVNTQNF